MNGLFKNIFIAAVVFLVAGAVAGGIVMIGSPAKERMRQLDLRRVDNLNSIAAAVDLYWTRHKSLPASIDDLSKEPGILIKTSDPETGRPYEYRTLEEKKYELCAYFTNDTVKDLDTSDKNFWSHGKGRQCFQLNAKEIDLREDKQQRYQE
jgi:hypothetical protein